MSKLEELIQKYSPDGVEYKPLKEVLKIKNGRDYKHLGGGSVPVYGSGGIMTYVDTPMYSKPSVLIPRKGSIDKLYYVDTPFWNVDTVFYTEIDTTQVVEKYLFYLLQKEHLEKLNTAGGVPSLTQGVLNEVMIPVPPLPVQEEIVRVLDTFTELQAELQAELQKRLQQYNYYRDNLLSFEGENNPLKGFIQQYCPDGVEYHKVKDVYKRLKGTPITAGKMKEINTPGGAIRVFAGGKTVIDANEEDIPNANITRVPAVLVQSRGVIDAIYYDKPFTFKNEMWAYTTKNVSSVKFLYYILKANIQTFRDAASGMGSLPQISLGVTEDYIIPVPPLPVQQKIVDILDRFDALTTDLSQGLPAEIEKRRQQYEYYRDKLLTFKRKEA